MAGKYPKLSVNWSEGPYIIDRKIGPVKFAIRGPKGGVRIYHHNKLRPVLSSRPMVRVPQPLALEGDTSRQPDLMSSIVVTVPQVPELQDTMNRQQFVQNVLNTDPGTLLLASTAPTRHYPHHPNQRTQHRTVVYDQRSANPIMRYRINDISTAKGVGVSSEKYPKLHLVDVMSDTWYLIPP